MLERWYSSDSSDEGSDLGCIAAAANSLPASPEHHSWRSHVSRASGSIASGSVSSAQTSGSVSSVGSRLSLSDRRKSKLRARIKVKARSDKADDQA